MRYVLPGSIIYTDCWSGYKPEDLETMEMGHGTVNHSYYYVDPITGVHTNSIEGIWAAIKRNLPPRQRRSSVIGPHLMYYWWRKRFYRILFVRFIYIMGLFRNDETEDHTDDSSDDEWDIENANLLN